MDEMPLRVALHKLHEIEFAEIKKAKPQICVFTLTSDEDHMELFVPTSLGQALKAAFDKWQAENGETS
jgi:hypothetical protein